MVVDWQLEVRKGMCQGDFHLKVKMNLKIKIRGLVNWKSMKSTFIWAWKNLYINFFIVLHCLDNKAKKLPMCSSYKKEKILALRECPFSSFRKNACGATFSKYFSSGMSPWKIGFTLWNVLEVKFKSKKSINLLSNNLPHVIHYNWGIFSIYLITVYSR